LIATVERQAYASFDRRTQERVQLRARLAGPFHVQLLLMHPRLAFLVSVPLATLAACAGDPPLPPAPLTVAVPVPAAPSSVPSPPPGEHWLTASAAAGIGTEHAAAVASLSVAAHVDLDEHHRATVHAARSGVVAAIPVRPGQRVKKGDLLFSISHAALPAEPVRALIEGEIDSIDVHLGDAVTGAEASGKEATKLGAVVDLSQVIVVAVPPPSSLLGARAEFSPEAYPNRRYDGAVTFIAPDGQKLQVRMENPDHALRPGMHGSLSVQLPEHAPLPFEGVVVPRSALVGGASRVLVKGEPTPDGHVSFVETPVTIAFDGGGPTVVVTGLTKGAEFVWRAAAVDAN
jgi:multidrug efflux pump subunit AcrA (membrane-fusion protein)